ncbi:MAG: response regulator [Proteobacteria bacterium]|nr:response regulator [Pseudomonadota bacterium]
MTVITLFSGSHCHADEVAHNVAEKLGFHLITDKELIGRASARFEVAETKLERAMYGPGPTLDKLIHEKKRNITHIAYIRSTLAEVIKDDKTVYCGLAGHLLPKNLTHVLKVCLAAKLDYRIKLASLAEGINAKQAKKILNRDDTVLKKWTLHLFSLSPWDKNLYDVFIPMDAKTVDEATSLICENAVKPAVITTPTSQKAMDDFLLACQLYEALTKKARDVEVICDDGEASLTIDSFVIRLEHFKKDLEKIAIDVPGVKKVKIHVGPNFRQPNIYPDVSPPQKILLVDDEKEFVQALSERLNVRNLGGAIAYNGEEALSIIEADAPDVMILDLKMPGIDGIEVLRRIKKSHPKIEVIILTGHGSETEESLTRELGAFAYLQKPADIDVLARTMKEAYRKIEKVNDEKKTCGSNDV